MGKLSREEAVKEIVQVLRELEPTTDPYDVIESAKICFGISDTPPDGGF
ncbi:MAG: hypothetical protein HYS51_00395 [Candidatus Zambryskibacteria bacterium]|nr:hypothetical protein [Candidatus Zambryskibacteria bacterium]QQG46377.1 MAG: hypothetical protein HYY55_00835 [Candidatus Niyogibacteria bacterium]